MYEVSFKPSFIRQAKKLKKESFSELQDKIRLLKNKENHIALKVHKLHGELSDCYSFSLNHKIRVIFSYESKKKITLLAIGNHDIYKAK